jgi:YD repeat-containing protein
MHRMLLPLAVLAQFAMALPAQASETVVYTYDAKGRLVKVERTGIGSNSVVTEYKYDKADNRTQVKITGSTN